MSCTDNQLGACICLLDTEYDTNRRNIIYHQQRNVAKQSAAQRGGYMAGERKFVWFNVETEKEEYQEAQSMSFSTEVKRWLRERIAKREQQDERTDG